MEKAVALFVEQFDAQPTLAVRAPGRVNLIGEHVDYNDGLVLPMAIDRWTVIVGRENRSPRFRIAADAYAGELATFLNNGSVHRGRTAWANYVKGVIAQFNEAGHRVPSFDAAIASSIPIGSGLSSSAALEVATACFVELVMGIRLDPVRKIRWCQRAEHDFAAVPCGIMDQMASVLGRENHAMLIDCRSLEHRHVPLDASKAVVVVADSGAKHTHADSGYATRRSECEQIVREARLLHDPDTQSLRDLTMYDLRQIRRDLPEPLYRRARHVIGEIERTALAAEALGAGDFEAVGRLMNESHASLRDDYEAGCESADCMTALAREVEGVFGSRLTGGGFGGATVTLAHPDAADELIAHLQRRYPEKAGLDACAYRVRPVGGASPMPT